MIRPLLLALTLTTPALARVPVVKVVAPDEACPTDAPHEVLVLADKNYDFKICVEDVK